jgi:hypothetical protein
LALQNHVRAAAASAMRVLVGADDADAYSYGFRPWPPVKETVSLTRGWPVPPEPDADVFTLLTVTDDLRLVQNQSAEASSDR